MLRRSLTALLLLLGLAPLWAKPAPWYLWRSKLDGQQVCMQTSPGKGWEQVGGPFPSHRC